MADAAKLATITSPRTASSTGGSRGLLRALASPKHRVMAAPSDAVDVEPVAEVSALRRRGTGARSGEEPSPGSW